MKAVTNEIMQEFKNYLYEEERSAHTIEKYMRDIRFFREWLGNKSVDKSTVLAYKKALCEKYAPKSVNSILSSLNALFAFAGHCDLRVKTLKIQRRIFADKEKELSKAEYEMLLSAAKRKNDERLYYLMQTVASTGLRVSEIKYVTVAAVCTGQATVNCKGRLRQIFLPRVLCKKLKDYIKKQNIRTGAVFRTKTGKPLDRCAIWKMLKKLCAAAKVAEKKVFPHNFRHLFARIFYSVQKDIVRLADILGHSSVETTRIYTMESCATHIRLIEELGLVRGGVKNAKFKVK